MSDERQAEREAVADEAAEDLEVSDAAADDVKGGLLRRDDGHSTVQHPIPPHESSA